MLPRDYLKALHDGCIQDGSNGDIKALRQFRSSVSDGDDVFDIATADWVFVAPVGERFQFSAPVFLPSGWQVLW